MLCVPALGLPRSNHRRRWGTCARSSNGWRSRGGSRLLLLSQRLQLFQDLPLPGRARLPLLFGGGGAVAAYYRHDERERRRGNNYTGAAPALVHVARGGWRGPVPCALL